MAAILKPIFDQEITKDITLLKEDSGKLFVVTSEIIATGLLTLAAAASNGETVLIDTKTYTYKTTITSADGDVALGADGTDSRDNLLAAITLGTGSGTKYGANTTLHPTVTARVGTGDRMIAEAKIAGIAGNSIVTDASVGSANWDDEFLIGGSPTPTQDRSFIIELPQDDVDGGNYDFIFRDNGVSEDGTRKYLTTWTLSSGLTKPFQVSNGTVRGNPYNFRDILDTKGALQQVKLGGNGRLYSAGQRIEFVSLNGIWYASPPLGADFYGAGEI